MRYIVYVEKDDISIKDTDGNEVLYWVIDEWIEDPSVVIAIANAINLANTDPVEFRKRLSQSA